jgi:hypothetical protein
MRPISPRVRKILDERKPVCARRIDGGCAGRLTREHSLIYASRQIDEAWAIVFLCAYHHAVDEYQDGGDLQKEKNVWIALNQATDEELKKYSKAINYIRMRDILNLKYGKYYP